MLKKRILASSMASVMALGSVSVAAFADETKDYGEAVTAKELQEYVDSFEDFISDELANYGSVQGARFQAALDHAQTVLDDDESKATDYTAAYQMIKAVKDNLTTYTASQLGKLIEDNRKTYDKNNIRNEDLEDTYYTEDSFQKFHDAFDEAEAYVDSADATYITDAYVELEDAKKALEELDTVTKAEMRSAIKAYEQLELEMKSVESWRRGTISTNPKTGTSKNKGNLKKASLSMEELRDVVYGSSVMNYQYIDGDAWKSVIAKRVSDDDIADGHSNDDGKWIGSYDLDASTSVYAAIDAQHKRFDEVKSATVTSDVKIVAAYNAALDAVDVFNSWKEDTNTSGSKSKCATLEKKYHNQLVETFNIDGLKKIADGAGTGGSGTGDDFVLDGKKHEFLRENFYDTGKNMTLTYDSENHTLKADGAVYVIVDKTDGLMVPGKTTAQDITGADADLMKALYKDEATAKTDLDDESKQEVKKIAANNDILKYCRYVDQDLEKAQGELDEFKETLKTAMNSGSPSDVKTADGTDYVSDDKVEFTFVPDNYGETPGNFTLCTVKKKGGSGTDEDATKSNTKLLSLIDGYNAILALDAIVNDYGYYKEAVFTGSDDDKKYVDDCQGLMDSLADGKTIPKVTGSSKEWAIVYRELLYRLEDAFIAPKKTDATLAKLKDKIDEAYDLAEKTGDASLFSDPYGKMVKSRQTALEFYKAAKAQTGYKVEDSIELDDGKSYDLDSVYSDLKGKVDDLNKWFDDFQYGYGEIRDKIGEIATAIDDGTVTGTDELKGLLEDAAYKLSILEATKIKKSDDEDINAAFDDAREFQAPNRLKTNNSKAGDKIKPNDFEKDMKTAYEALTKAYTEALTGTAPSGVEGDVDNDGKVTFLDVNAVVDAFLGESTDATFDVNGDKAVNFLDVNAAVDLYLKAMG